MKYIILRIGEVSIQSGKKNQASQCLELAVVWDGAQSGNQSFCPAGFVKDYQNRQLSCEIQEGVAELVSVDGKILFPL